MRAVIIQNHQLIMEERPVPVPQENELLIEVHYAGLNRADLFQMQGSYAPPPDAPQDIPGLEVSGIVAEAGDNVTRYQKGDEVCALLSGGGYAEYVTCKAPHALPVPKPLSLKQVAGLPECVTTVWMALFDEAKLAPSQTVLVHGGASGIGTTAIQMVKAYGCEIIVTAGSKEKCALCESLSAKAIHYKEQDFVAEVKNMGGVDVILDMVGGKYMQRNLTCLRPGGRLVSIAFLNGPKAELSMGGLLLKNLRWSGVTLRGRSAEQKAAYLQDIEYTVWPWITDGTLSPVIDSVFSFKEVEKALKRMEECLHLGKILLQLRD